MQASIGFNKKRLKADPLKRGTFGLDVQQGFFESLGANMMDPTTRFSIFTIDDHITVGADAGKGHGVWGGEKTAVDLLQRTFWHTLDTASRISCPGGRGRLLLLSSADVASFQKAAAN